MNKKLMYYYFTKILSEIRMLKSGVRYLLSSRKRALYIGCTKMGNVGDESVFLGLKELLKEKIYLYEIPYKSPSSGSYFRKVFFKAPDYIILGGGTIIKKKKTESYLYLFNKFSILYPTAKLIVLGSGVADTVLAKEIGFPTDVLSWSIILNKCEFIGVRGVNSKKIIESPEWNVKNDIHILHDPAIYFQNEFVKVKKLKQKIGLNFCNILGRIYGQNQELVGNYFKELVICLLNQNWEIHLYPTTENDIIYMKECLGSDLYRRVYLYEKFKNVKESLAFFDTIDIFLGQRLHSVIFSAITYTPFYAIEYESKTSDFLNSLGGDYTISRTDSLNVDNTLKGINSIYKNIHQEQNNLFVNCNRAKLEQEECIVKLFSQI